MANVTATSADDYVIELDVAASGTAHFLRLLRDAPPVEVAMVPGKPASNRGQLHWSNVAAAFQRSGGVDFWMNGTSGDTAIFELYSTAVVKASLNASGEMLLTNGSLRLPIVTTLPSSPTEGQVVIYDNTSSSWKRLAAYIDGGWRYSADL